MKEALLWIQVNWEAIALIAVALTGILNAVTKHFNTHSGVKKWAAFLLDILAPIVSKGSPGFLKVPGLSVSPRGEE